MSSKPLKLSDEKNLNVKKLQDEVPDRFRHCFISWAYINGGSTTAHYEYCNELSLCGQKVTLIVRGTDKPYKENDNFLIYPIAPTRYGEKVSHFYFIYIVLHHLVHERYDFVNTFFAPGVSVFPLLLFLKRTRWVLHIRTSATRTGLVKYIKNILGHLEASVYKNITVIDRGMAKNLYFTNKTIEDFLELPLGVSSRSFFHNTDERDGDGLLGISTGNKIILIYVGKMDDTRRLDILINAYHRVVSSKPNCLLLMVGDGNQRSTLEKIVSNLNLNDSVIFTGTVPYKNVAKYIEIADIALTYIPISSLYDNQPALKALEYLQMEVAQVATSTQANSKVIKDGVNGILTRDDEKSFAQGIIHLLDDDNLRIKISKQCRTGIKQYYWETIVREKLIPFYKKIGK